MPKDRSPKYTTPVAFRQALESRLRRRARDSGVLFRRAQASFVVERLMVRLAVTFGDDLIIKGGVALEFRLPEARATKDLDVRLAVLAVAEAAQRIQRAGRLELGDYFTFAIELDERHPAIAGPGVPYEGTRYRVTPSFAGKRYGGVFGLDVATGGPVLLPVDSVPNGDVLSFALADRVLLRLLSRETHVAEKLHAYTLPRTGKPNSRIKDLPDLALLARTGPFDGKRLRSAIRSTFEHRATHEVPGALPPPPPGWRSGYAEMAEENSLPWSSLREVFEATQVFVDGLLGGSSDWSPSSWSWE